MNWLREVARRLRMLVHRRQFDADLEEEMQLHLELRQQEHLESGMTVDSARAAARRRFGNVTALREKSHMAWGWDWFENLVQDVGYGLRMLRKNPAFTAVPGAGNWCEHSGIQRGPHLTDSAVSVRASRATADRF